MAHYHMFCLPWALRPESSLRTRDRNIEGNAWAWVGEACPLYGNVRVRVRVCSAGSACAFQACLANPWLRCFPRILGRWQVAHPTGAATALGAARQMYFEPLAPGGQATPRERRPLTPRASVGYSAASGAQSELEQGPRQQQHPRLLHVVSVNIYVSVCLCDSVSISSLWFFELLSKLWQAGFMTRTSRMLMAA